MPVNTYITSSCTISNHVICKGTDRLFENKGVSLADFLLSAYQKIGASYPKFYKMDMLCKLGWLATEILLKDSFSADSYSAYDTGIVLTNAAASLDTDIKYYETAKDIASPALFVYTLPNIVIGEICIRHGFKGESGFFISENFDAEFLTQYVTNLINNNILQACICGRVEVLKEGYNATLFLVEKKPVTASVEFTSENLIKIYESENG